MKKRIIASVIALVIGALACNFPSSAPTTGPGTQTGPDAAFTIAAQTVEAELTLVALAQPTTPAPLDEPTSPPEAAATQAPAASPTQTPIPCNLASFVSDVTIPDGTSILTGSTFTKTWRLRNAGSCTWNTSYALVFDRGEKMSGPDSQPLAGSVAPGQTVDISVTLTAPNTPGSHRGHWRLRDGGGVLFGISTGSFWVDIKSVAPTETPSPTATNSLLFPVTIIPPIFTLPAISFTIDAPLVAAESGSVRSDASVYTVRNVGDTVTNLASQVFLSFDISAIPAGATILEAKVDFRNYDTLGSPFSLNCMRMYPQNYGTLEGGDFFVGIPIGAVTRWCNTTELNTVTVEDSLKNALQTMVGNPQAQFRVQFNQMATNNNNVADMVRLGTGIKLVITYRP